MSENAEKNKNAFSGFLRYFYGNFVVLVLGFISVPLITRVMSEEEYGRTGMFTSAVTVLYIFAILGMDQTYIRYYYKEGVDRKNLLARCLFPAFFIVLAICSIYVLFSVPANGFLFGQQGIDLTALVVAYTVISVFERFLFLDIRMSQNGKLYSNLNILSKVLYIVFVLLFVFFMGDDFRVVMWAMTLSLGIITLFIGVRYLLNNDVLFKKNLDTSELLLNDVQGIENPAEQAMYSLSQKELIQYGIPFILVLLMEWLLSSCDKWALRIWSGYGELGIYNSAMNIMTILLTFKATFVAFWSPVAMEKHESETYEKCVEFFKSAFNITRFFCVSAGIGLIMFKDIIVYILGPRFREASSVIPFLTLMPIFSILFEITNQGIKFKKKNRYLNYASLLAIICNIAGNAILVPRLGGVGAAIATGITYMAYFAVGSFFAERCYRVGYESVKTAAYALLLIAYATLATFGSNVFVIFGVGAAGLIAIMIIVRRILVMSVSYVLQMVKKTIGKARGRV